MLNTPTTSIANERQQENERFEKPAIEWEFYSEAYLPTTLRK